MEAGEKSVTSVSIETSNMERVGQKYDDTKTSSQRDIRRDR